MNWLDYLLGWLRPKPGPPKPPDPPDPPPVVVIAGDLVEMLNKARAQHGIPPVSEHPGDMQAAQMQSGRQARRDRIGHDGPPGLEDVDDRLRHFGVSFVSCGEIVASGYPPPPPPPEGESPLYPPYTFIDAVVSWLKSPGHRAILLSPKFTHAGAAIADAQSGRPYATAVFHR